MLARTLSRLIFRNSAHKEVHTAEIIAKMHSLRQEIKTEENEIEELKKQVAIIRLRSNRRNRKPTRRIRSFTKRESG